ncbi:hypothetical protein [Blastococcus sp. SYSU D00820]
MPTWAWIVLAIVLIGGILAFWVANAARLARKNKQLHRRGPTAAEQRADVRSDDD